MWFFLKMQFVIFAKLLHICQFWEPIEWDCASKTLLASPPFSIQKLNILIKETLQLCEVSYKTPVTMNNAKTTLE